MRKSLAIEGWQFNHIRERLEWLEEHFGKAGNVCEDGRWALDYDYDLINLIMDEDVYTLFSLRWL